MSLPSGLVDGPPVKSKTLIAAFEKELAYLNSYVRKNKHEDRKRYAHAQCTLHLEKSRQLVVLNPSPSLTAIENTYHGAFSCESIS